MIEAHISGPRGSLYYSAPTTPYDLENLRTHVREASLRLKASTRTQVVAAALRLGLIE